MSPTDFLGLMFEIAPAFRAEWESDNNLFVQEDGSYNFQSVCCVFSHYFIDQEKHKYVSRNEKKWNPTIADSELVFLFDLFESNIDDIETTDSLKTPEGLLSNAICTCFLENISQTNAGEYAKDFMGNKSRTYFDHWHIYSKRL
ncbi:hypothetical protein M2404_003112 [Rheinheimera pacifica]|uniref:hypothetical protein n=1 Tax=Rheinheimera pacifica TaxID=173990 RepID=UPI0021672662|nr:hypothetical protein [Rheinheimera pacifica]MCS4308750.1 hypothetical protein [Rheinheimera pacifica]